MDVKNLKKKTQAKENEEDFFSLLFERNILGRAGQGRSKQGIARQGRHSEEFLLFKHFAYPLTALSHVSFFPFPFSLGGWNNGESACNVCMHGAAEWTGGTGWDWDWDWVVCVPEASFLLACLHVCVHVLSKLKGYMEISLTLFLLHVMSLFKPSFYSFFPSFSRFSFFLLSFLTLSFSIFVFFFFSDAAVCKEGGMEASSQYVCTIV